MNSTLIKRVFPTLGSVRWKSSCEIRQAFVKYFEDNDHIHIPSSSAVSDDETLLFTTAGMHQFKSIFLNDPDTKWKGLRKAVSYQKCMRAGGKHNDLDDVGHDLHHQTFFEMLGNWSFNNAYSKEYACHLAWEFLIEKMKIDPDRLYLTYFGGNSSLPPDNECKAIWTRIGIPDNKILPFNEENFWEMGFSGPCGMSTEIHFDRIPGRKDASHLVNKENSVVEIWNIVFMDKQKSIDGQLFDLPNSHIDTGMGLERLVSVVQNVDSNYDTDLFIPLIKKVCQMSSCEYKGSLSPSDSAVRLVVDHIRASTIAIKDGAYPAGTGPGFVVRKMLRRAFLQSSNILKIERGGLSELIPIIADTLKSGYFDLTTSAEAIQELIRLEELNFWKKVGHGKNLFDSMSANLNSDNKIFPGTLAWSLHSTHGLPIDVTTELARAEGREVDFDEFKKFQEEAKNISKTASGFKKEVIKKSKKKQNQMSS